MSDSPSSRRESAGDVGDKRKSKLARVASQKLPKLFKKSSETDRTSPPFDNPAPGRSNSVHSPPLPSLKLDSLSLTLPADGRTRSGSQTARARLEKPGKRSRRRGSIDGIFPIEEPKSVTPRTPDTTTESPTSSFEEGTLHQRDTSQDKKFRKRFELPGEKVIDNFLCTLVLSRMLLAQGSLYVTQNYVCFFAKLLHKKVEVVIPFADIICIRKCRALRSIPNSIQIQTADRKYYWTSFLHRSGAFGLMDSRWRLIRKKLGMPVIDQVDPDDIELDEIDVDVNINFSEIGQEVMYDECRHECVNLLNVPPRYNELFRTSVTEFFQRFVSDKSLSFWKEVVARDGHEVTSCTEWTPSSDHCCFERQMEFRTQVRSVFYLSGSTRVLQEQRYRFISPSEFIFETVSVSKDVPYSSHFFVESRWRIKAYEEDSCELSISVGVRFTKKLWMRSVIEEAAIYRSREWFREWIQSAMTVIAQRERHLSVDKLSSSNPDIVPRESLEELTVIEERDDGSPRAPRAFNVAILYFLILWRRLRPCVLMCAAPVFVLLLSMIVYFYGRYSSVVQVNIQLENEVHELRQEIYQLQNIIQQFVEQEALAKVHDLRE